MFLKSQNKKKCKNMKKEIKNKKTNVQKNALNSAVFDEKNLYIVRAHARPYNKITRTRA